jgi:hypothetical protein
MTSRSLRTGRLRPVVIGLGALVILAAVFSFAPARHAAAQLLSVFRVREFQVVTVNQTRSAKLQTLEGLMDGGVLGKPVFLRQPGEPQPVADLASASAAAGFHVRAPGDLPEGAVLKEFTVATGPDMRLVVERDMAAAALAMSGIDDVSLPPLERFDVEVDVPAVVAQVYDIEQSEVQVIQAPSPTVTVPSGVPLPALGEALLQLLGVPSEDARRLATEIDWTTTLVVPLPENVGRYRDVAVNGAPGLLLESLHHDAPGVRMVLWQRDGIVYAVTGQQVTSSLLMQLATSLR